MQAAISTPQPKVAGPVKLILGIFLLGPMYVMTTLTLLMMIAFYVFIVPQFKDIAKDFGMQLSGPQRMIFAINDALQGRFLLPVSIWAASAVIVVMTAVAVLFFNSRTKSVASVLILLIFLVAAAGAAFTIFSCTDLIAKLIEGLSENGAKSV
jgi:type II secretory pathway component PulF